MNKKIYDKNFIKNFEQAIDSCKTITEFRKKYTGKEFKGFCYFLNKNLIHYKQRFVRQKFSTQQLICKIILERILNTSCTYNGRKVLKGIELDIYFDQYKLACEYDSFYWHAKRVKADIKKNKLCKKHNITLVRISEKSLNKHQTFKSSLKNIKEQIINNLHIINKTTKKSIIPQQVLNIYISQEEIFKECYSSLDIPSIVSTCQTYAQFRTKFNRVWQYMRKNNLMHLLEPLKQRDHRHMSKEAYFAYILSECKTYNNFLKHQTYPFAYRRGYSKEIKQLYSK